MLIHLFLALSLTDDIIRVESGGSRDPAHVVGDHGKALGHAQCHEPCYRDALTVDKSLPPYKDACSSREASCRIIRAYWARWGAKTDRERCLLWHYGATFARKHPGLDPDHYFDRIKMGNRPEISKK